MHLRAVGEYPAAADALGINVYRLRYFYVFVGGVLAGLAGATISLAVSPGWFSELTTAGQGWIAVGLVIFAQWDPLRAAFGSYTFGALRRLILDIQGPTMLLGLRNPFYYNPYWGFFLQMLPYAFTIIVLVIGSREAMRKRLGAPAAWAIRISVESAAITLSDELQLSGLKIPIATVIRSYIHITLYRSISWINSLAITVRCAGRNTSPTKSTYTCPKDGGNLDVVLDYDAHPTDSWTRTDYRLSEEASLWRYLPLLPVADPGGLGTPLRAAGWTPVFCAASPGADAGLEPPVDQR